MGEEHLAAAVDALLDEVLDSGLEVGLQVLSPEGETLRHLTLDPTHDYQPQNQDSRLR